MHRRSAQAPFTWWAIMVIGLVFRAPVIAIGPLLPAIQSDLDLTYLVSGALITVPVLFMGILSPLTIPLVMRWSAQRILGASLVVIAIAGVARNAMPDAVSLLLMTGLLGVAMALGNAVLPLATAVWYRGATMSGVGAMATGLNVGGAAAGAVAGFLMMQLGSWRWALTCIALVSVPAIVGWLLLERQTRTAPSQPDPSAEYSKSDGSSPRRWVLYSGFALNCALAYAMSAWLPSIYADRGWSLASAGALVGVYNAASLSGGLMAMRLARTHPRASRILTACALAVGVIMIAASTSAGVLWCAIAGFGNGMSFTTFMAQPRLVARSRREFETVNALMLGVGYGIASVIPLVLGLGRDLSGGFGMGLAATAVCAVLLAVMLNISATRTPPPARSG